MKLDQELFFCFCFSSLIVDYITVENSAKKMYHVNYRSYGFGHNNCNYCMAKQGLENGNDKNRCRDTIIND